MINNENVKGQCELYIYRYIYTKCSYEWMQSVVMNEYF